MMDDPHQVIHRKVYEVVDDPTGYMYVVMYSEADAIAYIEDCVSEEDKPNAYIRANYVETL